MCRLLEATCSAAGVVTADGVSVPAAEVLSEGKKASSGILLLEADKAKYLPSSASDIKDLITKLVEIVQQIETIATGIDGASNSPGGQTSAIAQLATKRAALNSMKDALK
jgi:hypothetical protein